MKDRYCDIKFRQIQFSSHILKFPMNNENLGSYSLKELSPFRFFEYFQNNYSSKNVDKEQTTVKKTEESFLTNKYYIKNLFRVHT